jgi:hydroxyacylglutathione hydrolase
MNIDSTQWRFRAADHPQVEAIAAFSDNYIWLLHDPQGRQAAVVDPGDAEPVLATLQRLGLQLSSILITHHHRDHTGGIEQLVHECGARVFGPATETIAGLDQPLVDGDSVEVWSGGPVARVIGIPGHTLGHIAFTFSQFGIDPRPVLFCGDTMFAAGCGRVFEGTPAQMLASLDRLAALDPATLVYCAHEYTVGNLRFARATEPAGSLVEARLEEALRMRAAGLATLPSTIGIEKVTNPFLRADSPGLRNGIQQRLGRPPVDRLECFSALRDWKNGFR